MFYFSYQLLLSWNNSFPLGKKVERGHFLVSFVHRHQLSLLSSSGLPGGRQDGSYTQLHRNSKETMNHQGGWRICLKLSLPQTPTLLNLPWNHSCNGQGIPNTKRLKWGHEPPPGSSRPSYEYLSGKHKLNANSAASCLQFHVLFSAAFERGCVLIKPNSSCR